MKLEVQADQFLTLVDQPKPLRDAFVRRFARTCILNWASPEFRDRMIPALTRCIEVAATAELRRSHDWWSVRLGATPPMPKRWEVLGPGEAGSFEFETKRQTEDAAEPVDEWQIPASWIWEAYGPRGPLVARLSVDWLWAVWLEGLALHDGKFVMSARPASDGRLVISKLSWHHSGGDLMPSVELEVVDA